MALTPPSDPCALGKLLPNSYLNLGYDELCVRCRVSQAAVGPKPWYDARSKGSFSARKAWEERRLDAKYWAKRKRKWLRDATLAFLCVHQRECLPVSVPKDVARLIVVHIKRGGGGA